MSTEDEIKQLRDTSSHLKSQVTKISAQIQTAMQRKKSLESLIDSLKETCAKFTESHEMYCDTIDHDADGSLDSYKTVNNLSLKDYYAKVKECYKFAMENVVQYEVAANKAKADEIVYECGVLMSQKEFFMDKLNRLPLDNTPARDIVFTEIDIFINRLKNFVGDMRNINIGDYSSLTSFYDNVSACIISLGQNVLQAKQKPYAVKSSQPTLEEGSAQNP